MPSKWCASGILLVFVLVIVFFQPWFEAPICVVASSFTFSFKMKSVMDDLTLAYALSLYNFVILNYLNSKASDTREEQ